MKQDTRQAILDTARRLFSERGYNAVSIRDLAEELGISKGNLTYHFQRKEQIVEALLRQNTADGISLSVPGNMGALDALFRRQYGVVQANAFYFWHYDQLAQVSPAISAMQLEAREKMRGIYRAAFCVLQEAGMLLPEDTAGRSLEAEREQLIDALIMTAVYWLPYHRLMRETEAGPEKLAARCWSLLIPWLSREGRAELAALGA